MTQGVDALSVILGERTVGMLTRLSDDRIAFSFDPSYQDDPDRPTLSLGFKSRDGGLVTPRTSRTRLPPFFANLLPEGALRDYLAARIGTKSVRDFPLIAVLGVDLPGNVRVLPASEGPLLTELGEVPPPPAGPLKFSLAGVQLKFSALEGVDGGLTIPARGDGGDWIVKLPSVVHAGVPAHEYAMMELARAFGIETPEVRLVNVADVQGVPAGLPIAEPKALAVRRFDRGEGARIHVEDFAQVFGTYPEDKYRGASSESLARVLLAESGVAAVVELVRRLVFTVLIGNGDMHLKNWSLIYRDGKNPSLSPIYDQIATVLYLPDDELGLSIGGTRSIQQVGREHFIRFAERVGVPVSQVGETVRRSVAGFHEAWREVAGRELLRPEEQVRLEQHFRTLAIMKAAG